MPNQTSLQLRALAFFAALALALMAAFSALGVVRAQDASPVPPPNGCAVASETKGAPAGTPAAGANCVVIGMFDIYYSANLITIPSNTDITFVLQNQGAAGHDFSITDHENKGVKNLNINQSVDPGKSTTIKINAPAGTYYFFCNVPGHEAAGMWGILKVADNGHISAQRVDNPKTAS